MIDQLTLIDMDPAAVEPEKMHKEDEPDVYTVTVKVERNGVTMVEREINDVEIFRSMITDATSVIIPGCLCSITDHNCEIWTR